ncbi:spherulin-2A-like [Achroia grisella]|uniref:spherulin-2A-like n=1 Tax=Achroia grisella TaxID=688607 RepID=UPI0027D1F9F0|nr:spherulin-2A-like [Achroia grisella]
MALKYLAIFIIIPIVYARIDIKIKASDDPTKQYVRVSGSDRNIISDTERHTFQLGDNNLKNAVNTHFGKRPDDAFLRSPTPWGDLYQTYGWNQVNCILTPSSARILGVSSTPTMVFTQIFHNNSSLSSTFNAQIQQQIQSTVTSTWEKEGAFTVGQEINYGYDIEVFAVTGTTSYSYTAKWGESVTKTESVTVGSQSGVEMPLQPGQSVVAELFATRGTMKIQVDYQARLSGSVAVNYSKKHNGHHFWRLDVNSVMRSANMKTSITSKEIIEVGFYSDSKVVVRDYDTHAVLYVIPMQIF